MGFSLITHKDVDVRFNAARAIGRIARNSEKVRVALREVISRDPDYVTVSLAGTSLK